MHSNRELIDIIKFLDLGSPVAEDDNLLETARIETATFSDLINDRVDLIIGTKGSGKSSLFRIFVDFLPDTMIEHRKVVVAHGVKHVGDPVFHAFKADFEKLSEEEFINFWCIYLVSLAHEQFIKDEKFHEILVNCESEIAAFKIACEKAKIPEIKSKKSLFGILEWALNAVKYISPKITYTPADGHGEYAIDLFGAKTPPVNNDKNTEVQLPKYLNEVKETLERILEKNNHSLWLMVDRLDEIFPRRSKVERTALRGLLKAMNYFKSEKIRIKVFLRDDMLEQVVRDKEGFTALTHITARQSDTLRWSEDQILAMMVKRICANAYISTYLKIDPEKISAQSSYREECFYKIFPPTVFSGNRQSSTIRWIYSRCSDGRGVVTPRDVLDLIIRARQRQLDLLNADPDGSSDCIISQSAIRYGFEELSKKKRQTYLEAEFPHLWLEIEKFIGGKTEYNDTTLKKLLGKNWENVTSDLVNIGFLSKSKKVENQTYSIPKLYRHAMEMTQGKA